MRGALECAELCHPEVLRGVRPAFNSRAPPSHSPRQPESCRPVRLWEPRLVLPVYFVLPPPQYAIDWLSAGSRPMLYIEQGGIEGKTGAVNLFAKFIASIGEDESLGAILSAEYRPAPREEQVAANVEEAQQEKPAKNSQGERSSFRIRGFRGHRLIVLAGSASMHRDGNSGI